jgi:hypothetical protein
MRLCVGCGAEFEARSRSQIKCFSCGFGEPLVRIVWWGLDPETGDWWGCGYPQFGPLKFVGKENGRRIGASLGMRQVRVEVAQDGGAKAGTLSQPQMPQPPMGQRNKHGRPRRG